MDIEKLLANAHYKRYYVAKCLCLFQVKLLSHWGCSKFVNICTPPQVCVSLFVCVCVWVCEGVGVCVCRCECLLLWHTWWPGHTLCSNSNLAQILHRIHIREYVHREISILVN